MSRCCFALELSLALCLAGSAGCCSCQHGFALRGDWSLQMDSLPGNGCQGQCGQGGCLLGHAEPDPPPIPGSAAPGTSPRFHPLPTAPVGNVMQPPMSPTPAGPPPNFSPAANYNPTPENGLSQTPSAPPSQPTPSVLTPDPPTETGSSWMFVHRTPASAPPAQLADRRQLSAEGWTPKQRR